MGDGSEYVTALASERGHFVGSVCDSGGAADRAAEAPLEPPLPLHWSLSLLSPHWIFTIIKVFRGGDLRRPLDIYCACGFRVISRWSRVPC